MNKISQKNIQNTGVAFVPAIKISNTQAYLHNVMQDDANDFRNASQIKTGYANMDTVANFYPGLYVIGAISSLGKTTFIHQMCDQMARNGEHIIYFSLEQSTLELASKSLSRIMAQKDASNALTSLQIRNDFGTDSRISEAIAQYDEYAERVTIAECSFQATIFSLFTL